MTQMMIKRRVLNILFVFILESCRILEASRGEIQSHGTVGNRYCRCKTSNRTT